MKKVLASLIFSASLSLVCQSQAITLPRTPSPGASVSQSIGISKVTVDYSRPSVRGREVWGSLVPYGWNVQAFGTGNSAPWRAGANENTVIRFSHPVKVEGVEIPAGTYGLFFVVNEDNTGEVILSKDHHSWGSFFYDKANDVARAKIPVRDHEMTEQLTYDFVNLNKNSAVLVLNWEKKQLPVKIEFDVDRIVLDNAKNELKGTVGFSWQGPMSAANYAVQNNLELDQALIWANQAVAQNNSFATLRVKSDVQRALGNKGEAEKTMESALAIATENELNQYGYQLLGQYKFDEAIAILALTTKKFPKSANAFDSLGEAYALKGDKKNAVLNFRKSLGMNPTAGTRANSEKYLKQLGEM